MELLLRLCYNIYNNLNRHQKKRIPLPFPRFIVFYNGEQELPEVFEMRLSDSFGEKDEKPAVECVARVININYGHNTELLNSCKRLHDYSYLVASVREYIKKGYSHKDSVVRTVDECIEKGILSDVLVKNRAEVDYMFLTTFDKKMYEEALRSEGREEENINTERERERADAAEARVKELETELARLREENMRMKTLN